MRNAIRACWASGWSATFTFFAADDALWRALLGGAVFTGVTLGGAVMTGGTAATGAGSTGARIDIVWRGGGSERLRRTIRGELVCTGNEGKGDAVGRKNE